MSTNLIFWAPFISIAMLIVVSEGCSIITNRPIEQALADNKESPWIVLVTDEPTQQLEDIKALTYGAIIHPKLVVTPAVYVSRVPQEKLLVLTECSVTLTITCDNVTVDAIFHSKNFDENNIKESDWAILKLSKPLKFTETVDAIRLAADDDDWDPEECLIHHMTPVLSTFKGVDNGPEEGGLRHDEFRFSINPDYFGFYYISKVYMTIEFDTVFGNFTGREDELTKTRRVSFKGSPIACWLRNESDVVLVGFSTMVYEIPHKLDVARDEVELIEGGVVDFTHDLDDFNKPGYLDSIV